MDSLYRTVSWSKGALLQKRNARLCVRLSRNSAKLKAISKATVCNKLAKLAKMIFLAQILYRALHAKATCKLKRNLYILIFAIQATRFKYAVCTLISQSIFQTTVSSSPVCAPVTGHTLITKRYSIAAF